MSVGHLEMRLCYLKVVRYQGLGQSLLTSISVLEGQIDLKFGGNQTRDHS